MFLPPEFRAELRNKRGFILLALVLLLGLAGHVPAQTLPTPPPQPSSGPGGSNYFFGAVTQKGPYYAAGHGGNANFKYFTFEPASPKPTTAPVILFMHGFLANTPSHYQAWINHMVRKGYTVVWVQYDSGFTLPNQWLNNALASWKDALQRLNIRWWEGHVLPQVGANGQFETGYVGHSAGAYLSVSLAEISTNPANGIPKPLALVSVEPGIEGLIPAPPSFADIDPATKFVVVVGDVDTVVCTKTAVFVWDGTGQIASRNFLAAISDSHGSPAQLGNHYFPNTDGFKDTAAIDDRDFNITWKLSVAAMDCALNNVNCTIALGNGSDEQITMGNWSDGFPVHPLLFVLNPDALVLPCQSTVH